MAFTERLAFIVQANVDQFIREIGKAGDAADKQVNRAKSSTEKFSAQATKYGAGLVAFAGIAGAGLVRFAQDAEDANRPLLQLRNTIANMPKLAGENADQFISLATAIQATTAADADQIVSAEAMLGTFRLSAEQIKAVTPLVVDYSRKFGIDLVGAAIQVGKALDGQIGALKRNGVSIDEVLFKTDRYRAVTEALRTQVGGFAEVEGATLSGRLERLKNQFGDVEEGVGSGVAGAFSALLTPLEKSVDLFSKLSPETQASIGKIAAIATVTAAASGGLLLLAGQAKNVKDAFSQNGVAAGKFGTAIKGLAAVGGTVAAIAAVDAAMQQMGIGAESATKSIRDLATASDDAIASQFKPGLETDSFFDKLAAHGGSTVADAIRKRFRGIASESEAAAQRIIDSLNRQGLDTSKYVKILDEEKAKNRQLSADQRDNADATNAQGDAFSETADKAKELADKLKATSDAIIDLPDAQRDYASAIDDVAKAQKELADAQNLAPDPQKVAAATDDLASAQLDAKDAADHLADAQNRLNDLRRSAPDPLEMAHKELAAKQALLGAKEAQTGLREAQENLDRVRRSGAGADYVEQAEQQVEEAQLKVESSTLDAKDAQKELDDLRVGSMSRAKELERAERDVERAKLGVNEANRRVRESQKNLDNEMHPDKAEALATAHDHLASALDRAEGAASRLVEDQRKAAGLAAQTGYDYIRSQIAGLAALMGLLPAGEAKSQVQASIDELTKLLPKDVLIPDKGRLRASGGPVWPGTWLVGERGPELVHLNGSGSVSNATDTRSMMAGESRVFSFSGANFYVADLSDLIRQAEQRASLANLTFGHAA